MGSADPGETAEIAGGVGVGDYPADGGVGVGDGAGFGGVDTGEVGQQGTRRSYEAGRGGMDPAADDRVGVEIGVAVGVPALQEGLGWA